MTAPESLLYGLRDPDAYQFCLSACRCVDNLCVWDTDGELHMTRRAGTGQERGAGWGRCGVRWERVSGGWSGMGWDGARSTDARMASDKSSRGRPSFYVVRVHPPMCRTPYFLIAWPCRRPSTAARTKP